MGTSSTIKQNEYIVYVLKMIGFRNKYGSNYECGRIASILSIEDYNNRESQKQLENLMNLIQENGIKQNVIYKFVSPTFGSGYPKIAFIGDELLIGFPNKQK